MFIYFCFLFTYVFFSFNFWCPCHFKTCESIKQLHYSVTTSFFPSNIRSLWCFDYSIIGFIFLKDENTVCFAILIYQKFQVFFTFCPFLCFFLKVTAVCYKNLYAPLFDLKNLKFFLNFLYSSLIQLSLQKVAYFHYFFHSIVQKKRPCA